MIDQNYLTEVSRVLLERNLLVLQGYRLGATDREHIAQLMRYMDLKRDAVWADIGCGFGEPARIMKEFRPDLTFHLVNNNQFQLDHAPEDMPQHLADMHALPFPDRALDGVMYLFSICHADDICVALCEAARVTKPGGELFVFDYMRTKGENYISWTQLAARFFGLGTMHYLCMFAGWEFGGVIAPKGDDAVWRSVFADPKLYERMFEDLTPVVWWATRK